jgi:hypothetical protein
MFTLDKDIVGAQNSIQEFNPIFRQAFKSYIAGEWTVAYDHIERCLELWENDGPTRAIQLYLIAHQYVCPDTWNGYRDINEQIMEIFKAKIAEEEEKNLKQKVAQESSNQIVPNLEINANE